MRYRSLSLIAFCATLCGCATVSSGTSQEISVDTPGADGASCAFDDGKGGRWEVASTPGAIRIVKGSGPLTLTCRRDGFHSVRRIIDETLADEAYGNVFLGGLGLIIDSASGAAVRYPDNVVLSMRPKS